MRISTDFVCIFPGIQQVVGVATILSNSVKAIYDLARALFTLTWKNSSALYEERAQALNAPAELKKIEKRILSLPGYQFELHTLYMLIGIIRAIPVLGTLYSAGVCWGNVKWTQIIDEPARQIG
ncbi:hypothetical protein [Candidatus Protochlamydia phocaeensis]|uniref:hypothetical protein n=1 Tax=Candidatus Protochlamydia phocaeensis TaxID=1414722 RepID=UPI0008389005|nr:hypothetical protein [Candidatus Protochlamydia phocaeensis]